MEHELKTESEYYRLVVTGSKTFEIRKNDRNFNVGDTLLLRETVRGGYTSNECRVKVNYICNYEQKTGYVVMAIAKHPLPASVPASVPVSEVVKDLERADNFDSAGGFENAFDEVLAKYRSMVEQPDNKDAQ